MSSAKALVGWLAVGRTRRMTSSLTRSVDTVLRSRASVSDPNLQAEFRAVAALDRRWTRATGERLVLDLDRPLSQ